LSVLTPKPDEVVALGDRQARIGRRWLRLTPALAAIGLGHPVTDVLRGGLELASQIPRTTAGASQRADLSAELEGVKGGRLFDMRVGMMRQPA
jgi:hypothetical protein